MVSEMKAYKISTRQAHTRVRLQPGEVTRYRRPHGQSRSAPNTKDPYIRRHSFIGEIISS